MADSPNHSYSIIKLLNSGIFAEVNMVQCRRSMKKFVMKEIGLQHVTEENQRAAFLEAMLLSTLHHRNIVNYVQAYLQSGGRMFILTEFCEGGDLFNLIGQRNGELFEESLIVDWLIQLCLGLKHLHDNKILHRDLKTKNIYLTRNGSIKVGDLGLSCLLKSKQEMTTSVIGSPKYMCPEMHSSKPYNTKCDIWSLGCCMYEVSTLDQTFDAFSLFSLLQDILQEKPHGVPANYSSDFLKLISSMLAHDPDERPTAGDVLLSTFVREHVKKNEEKKAKIRNLVPHLEKKWNPKALPAFRQIQFSPAERLKPADLYKFIESYDDCDKKSREHLSSATSSISLNSIVTTPDINGNGDGNDNSVHQLDTKTELNKAISFGDAVVPRSKSQSSFHSYMLKNDIKENVTYTKWKVPANIHSHTAPCTGTSRRTVRKVAYTAMSVLKTPRNSGEISLDFLKNLSQAIKLSRFEKDHSPVRFGAPLSTKLCLSLPSLPDLNESCCFCSNRQKCRGESSWSFLERGIKSSYTLSSNVCNYSASTKCSSDYAVQGKCKNCANGFDPGEKLPLLADKSNLVLPKAADILKSDNKGDFDLPAADTNVDKGLIQHIVNCKKTNVMTQSALQRRRENMQCSQSNITKSAPASVETLPPL